MYLDDFCGDNKTSCSPVFCLKTDHWGNDSRVQGRLAFRSGSEIPKCDIFRHDSQHEQRSGSRSQSWQPLPRVGAKWKSPAPFSTPTLYLALSSFLPWETGYLSPDTSSYSQSRTPAHPVILISLTLSCMLWLCNMHWYEHRLGRAGCWHLSLLAFHVLSLAREKLYAQDWHAAAESVLWSTNARCIAICLILGICVMA